MSNKITFNPSDVQRQFLQAEEDVVFFGGGAGGGKTYAMLLDNLQGIHCPDFFSIFFRSTTTEIDKGLWPEAKKLYKPFLFDENNKLIGEAKILEQKKTITFPSGARTCFEYLERDAHADSYYGSEITKEYFDEFQFRSYYQFDVLRSRNRSSSSVKTGIRCSLNPDHTHFCYEFISRFLDDDYFPIREFSGKTAYFVIVNDVIHTSWDKEQLEKDYGKESESYTYIPATLDDNAYVDPSYRKRLDSMSEKKRKQLLLGCWAPTEDTGMHLQKSMFQRAASVPVGSTSCRGWDTAATAPEPGQTVNRYADWTAGIRISKCPEGNYYIHGGIEHFQARSGPRDQRIIRTARGDGEDVPIIMGVDAGAAGKTQFEQFARTCAQEGVICKRDPMPSNKKKLVRAEGFISAAQNGFVYIVESSIDKEDLEAFYNECERFDGERSASHKGKTDDIIDAAATAFNWLSQKRVLKIVPRNQKAFESRAAPVIDSHDVTHLKTLEEKGVYIDGR